FSSNSETATFDRACARCSHIGLPDPAQRCDPAVDSYVESTRQCPNGFCCGDPTGSNENRIQRLPESVRRDNMETDAVQTPVRESNALQNTPAVTADAAQDVRTGLQADTLRQSVTDHLRYSIGRLPAVATPEHYYRALALAVRDRMQQRWTSTTQTYW